MEILIATTGREVSARLVQMTGPSEHYTTKDTENEMNMTGNAVVEQTRIDQSERFNK